LGPIPPGFPDQRPTQVRVLIADDQALFRQALAALLRERAGVEVSGEAVNGEEAIRLAMELKPDLILMDVTMPVINGLEAARRLAISLPNTPILIVTMHQNRELIQTAKEIGVRGYVSKSEVSERLFHAINEVLSGGTSFSDGASNKANLPKT
jgi:two-component system nitrate/nitrite response regulator NarL